MPEEMNEYEGEYDFLTQERDALSARLQALFAARPAGVPRRVPLTPVATDDAVTAAAHEFLGTPTGQNAMHYTPFFSLDEMEMETPFQNQMAFAALLSDTANNENLTEYTFLLASTITMDPEWICVICRDADGDIVSHPNNCHIFHRDCLNTAMMEDIRCPLCRMPAPEPHNMY